MVTATNSPAQLAGVKNRQHAKLADEDIDTSALRAGDPDTMALTGQQEESPKPAASPTSVRMIMITIEENDTAHYSPLGNADQCKGTAEHNSVKECSTGDLTLNSKGDTSARNRPHLKAGV